MGNSRSENGLLPFAYLKPLTASPNWPPGGDRGKFFSLTSAYHPFLSPKKLEPAFQPNLTLELSWRCSRF